MAILVYDQENKFQVRGEINQSTSIVLKHYVESQFRKFSNVTMYIDSVSRIDKNGLAVLTSIYHNSIQEGKVFIITGEGCKDIYDDFLMSA